MFFSKESKDSPSGDARFWRSRGRLFRSKQTATVADHRVPVGLGGAKHYQHAKVPSEEYFTVGFPIPLLPTNVPSLPLIHLPNFKCCQGVSWWVPELEFYSFSENKKATKSLKLKQASATPYFRIGNSSLDRYFK